MRKFPPPEKHDTSSQEIVAATLQAIRDAGLWVRPAGQIAAYSDPDDDIFLECAVAAEAEYGSLIACCVAPRRPAGIRDDNPRRTFAIAAQEKIV